MCSSIAHGKLFNDYKFMKWCARAVLHSALLFWVAHESLTGISDGSGKNNGLFYESTVVYTCVVLLATLRIFLELVNINFFDWLFIGLSFFGYFPVLFAASQMLTFNQAASDLFGLVAIMYASPNAWLTIVISVSTPILVDGALLAIKREWRPTYVDIMQERQRMSPTQLEKVDAGLQVSTFAVAQLTQPMLVCNKLSS